MKKLSEMGTLQVGTEWHPLRPMENAKTYFYWVFREEERRELVRTALIAFAKEWIYPADAWPETEQAAMTQIDAFIKEQGI